MPPFLYVVFGSPVLIALFGVEMTLCVALLCLTGMAFWLACLAGIPLAYLVGRVILYLTGKSTMQPSRHHSRRRVVWNHQVH